MPIPGCCPKCQGMRPFGVSATLGLFACHACGAALTLAELQEAAYEEGYRDALAETEAPAGSRRRKRS